MFDQVSVAQIRSGGITRDDGYIVLCMAYYPRGLQKKLIDEFRNNLAPDRTLFTEWKEFERAHGHEKAFELSHYEERFTIAPDGLESMRRLIDHGRAHAKTVYLGCQCEIGERCHREMLLLMLRHQFGELTGALHKSYPAFERRLLSQKKK